MYINGKVDNGDCAVVFMLVSLIRRREEERNHYRQISIFYNGFMENWCNLLQMPQPLTFYPNGLTHKSSQKS